MKALKDRMIDLKNLNQREMHTAGLPHNHRSLISLRNAILQFPYDVSGFYAAFTEDQARVKVADKLRYLRRWLEELSKPGAGLVSAVEGLKELLDESEALNGKLP